MPPEGLEGILSLEEEEDIGAVGSRRGDGNGRWIWVWAEGGDGEKQQEQSRDEMLLALSRVLTREGICLRNIGEQGKYIFQAHVREVHALIMWGPPIKSITRKPSIF